MEPRLSTPLFLLYPLYIKDEKNFEDEKMRLIAFVTRILEAGSDYFDNYESHSFGKLNKNEWNNMFYKHIDHHLRQFGA